MMFKDSEGKKVGGGKRAKSAAFQKSAFGKVYRLHDQAAHGRVQHLAAVATSRWRELEPLECLLPKVL